MYGVGVEPMAVGGGVWLGMKETPVLPMDMVTAGAVGGPRVVACAMRDSVAPTLFMAAVAAVSGRNIAIFVKLKTENKPRCTFILNGPLPIIQIKKHA